METKRKIGSCIAVEVESDRVGDKVWTPSFPEALIGDTIVGIAGLGTGEEEIHIYTGRGDIYRMLHYTDCCESVSVSNYELDGRFIPSDPSVPPLPVTKASERIDGRDMDYGHETKTTYTFIQNGGRLFDVEWTGESNGYYNESVAFEKLMTKAEADVANEKARAIRAEKWKAEQARIEAAETIAKAQHAAVVPGTATYLGKANNGGKAEQYIFKMEPPYLGHDHVVVSLLAEDGRERETYVFAAEEDGAITDLSELPCSFKGTCSVFRAMRYAGYEAKGERWERMMAVLFEHGSAELDSGW